MKKKPVRWYLRLLLIPAIAVLIVFAVRPQPLLVEIAQAVTGLLQESVESQGETRAHDRYTVAAPVSGRLMRIALHDGDQVRAGQAVAFMRPTPLDDRERDAAAARVNAATALMRAAEEQVARDRAECWQARRELDRTEQMYRQGISTAQALEQSRTAEQLAAATLAAAEYRSKAAAAQLQEARAALLSAEPDLAGGGRIIALKVPKSGPVLRVLEKSERVVAAGTPLLLIGDPARLEIVVDVLSGDAVKVRSGADVILDEWGGAVALKARVRIVEPYAFTKVSSLGIEEQRVNVIADFIDPPSGLGDGYRIMAKIITWSGRDVLKVPVSGLFRQGEIWCVFVVEQGRAARRTVTVGHRNQSEAEILGGLAKGDMIVLHPPSQLNNGMRVRER